MRARAELRQRILELRVEATVRVPEADFMNGKLGDAGGGWPNVQAVVTPTG